MIKYLFCILLIFSCVEHKFTFTVSPDGSYTVDYKSHGDRKDLLDYDFTVPNNSNWSINSTINDVEAESYDFIAHKEFGRNISFPTTFYNSDSLYFESLLKHPISVKYSNWFIKKSIFFNGKFEGRNVNINYPLVKEFIEDINNPPEGWLKEALSYLLNQTLIRSNIDWNNLPIITAELTEWINNELYTINDSLLFDEFDYYKNLGLDIIMQPTSPNIYNEIDSIFKLLEDELRITLDLIDDDFVFQVILPGELEFSNADSISENNLYWFISLKDYMNNDFIMFAKSNINYPNRQKLCLFLGIISILLFWKYKTKKIF